MTSDYILVSTPALACILCLNPPRDVEPAANLPGPLGKARGLEKTPCLFQPRHVQQVLPRLWYRCRRFLSVRYIRQPVCEDTRGETLRFGTLGVYVAAFRLSALRNCLIPLTEPLVLLLEQIYCASDVNFEPLKHVRRVFGTL